MSVKHYMLTVNESGLEQICDYAIKQGITYVWIAADSALEVCKTTYPLDADTWSCLPNWLYDEDVERVKGDNILASIHCYRKADHIRRRVNVIFLKHCRWSWNKEGITPRELYECVHELEELLGIPIGGSPASSGMKYQEKMIKDAKEPVDEYGKPVWLQQPKTKLSTIPWGDAVTPLIWFRTPSEKELGRKYLHAYDKNSCYARAAVNERFGIGEPVHVDSTRVESCYNPARPGLWRVILTSPTDIESDGIDWALLPPPPAPTQVPVWLSTPQVKMCKKRGYQVEFLEAWYFPRCEFVWRKWARDLWDKRHLDGSSPWVDAAIKQIMNDTMGLTNRLRQDWYSQFVGGAASVMQYNIVNYAESGCYPIGCMLDALYYLSDEIDPALAVPGILEHESSLGGYKKKWGIEVDDQVREILCMSSFNKQLELLNGIARERGL